MLLILHSLLLYFAEIIHFYTNTQKLFISLQYTLYGKIKRKLDSKIIQITSM